MSRIKNINEGTQLFLIQRRRYLSSLHL